MRLVLRVFDGLAIGALIVAPVLYLRPDLPAPLDTIDFITLGLLLYLASAAAFLFFAFSSPGIRDALASKHRFHFCASAIVVILYLALVSWTFYAVLRAADD